MKRILFILIALYLLFVCSTSALIDTDATDNADALLYSDYPNNNFGAESYFRVGDRDRKRTVLNFTLPSGSGEISKIELCMYRIYVENVGYISNTTLHNLSHDFIESEVTWINRTDGVAWDIAGGDFNPTVVDIVNMTGDADDDKWINWTIRGTDAENSMDSLTWGDTVLLMVNQSGDTYSFRADSFSSKEGANDPYIKITYSTAATPDPTTLDHTKGTTWVNHTWAAGSAPNVTDSYNVSINDTWHNTTTNTYHNNTPIPSGNWSNITVWAFNSTYSELSSGSVSEDVQSDTVPAAPSITSYAPLGTIWPEVQDSQLFNVTVNQSTQCRWYVNGSLAQTNSTPSLTHAYTNTSLNGGGGNVTAVCNNTNGTDSLIWLFEVGADSISYIVLSEDDTNLTCLIRWNVTRIGSNVTLWNTSYSNTTNGCTYYFNFDNGTEILNQTATSNDETLWFNHTSLLPIGLYFINGSCHYIALAANQHGMLRKNVTSAETFSTIAAGIAHDRCYTWWDSTNDRWESYRVGNSYNADKSVPEHDSYFVLMDGTGTTIVCGVAAAETVAIPSGWYATYLRESDAKTLAAIKTDMGGNVDNLWAFDPTAGAWTDTGTYSVLPNQGLMIDSSAGFNWDGTVT